MRSRRYLVARAGAILLLMLALGVPAPSPASHGASCGGSWSDDERCPFDFRGFPLIVKGEAFASTGDARIHAWITEPSTGVTLLACTETKADSASCRSEYGVGQMVDLLYPLRTLYCHVDGRSSGTYRCQSGRGF